MESSAIGGIILAFIAFSVVAMNAKKAFNFWKGLFNSGNEEAVEKIVTTKMTHLTAELKEVIAPMAEEITQIGIRQNKSSVSHAEITGSINTLAQEVKGLGSHVKKINEKADETARQTQDNRVAIASMGARQ